MEASAPLPELPAIQELVADENTALADQTQVTTVTQAALDTCQETVKAQGQEIEDQGAEIGTVKEDLAVTQTELQTQTVRKERYRAVAGVSTGLIVLRVIIGIIFHVPVF